MLQNVATEWEAIIRAEGRRIAALEAGATPTQAAQAARLPVIEPAWPPRS